MFGDEMTSVRVGSAIAQVPTAELHPLWHIEA
jgi:hypothetical protein